MSVDYTHDYSDHALIDCKPKYSKIYKLEEIEASDVHRGDLIVLKTPCNQYRIYVALDDADEDNTLHLTRYSEIEFAKFDGSERSGSVVLSSSDPCGYTYDDDTSSSSSSGGNMNNGGYCGC